MYYIEIFIFNIFSIKILLLNFFNLLLCNFNHLLINILLLLVVYSFLTQLKNYLFFILIIYYIYYINTLEFSILNNFYFGYYKIHPIILYTSLISLIYKLVLIKKIFKVIIFNIVSLSIIAFILGSLWALYQTQWGVYWSNDSIEIILLFFIIIGLSYMHINFKNNFYRIFFLTQTLFLLMCLRYNLLYTKHNFFTKIININMYQYIVYVWVLLIFIRQFLQKYYINTLYYWRVYFYCLMVQVFYNFINIKMFMYFNTLVFLFLFFYISLNIIYILKKKLMLHVIVIVFFIIFNLFDLNYQKKNLIYLDISWVRLNHYFYYTKNSDFLIFLNNKNLKYLYSFSNILLENKIFNFNQTEQLTKINIINYF